MAEESPAERKPDEASAPEEGAPEEILEISWEDLQDTEASPAAPGALEVFPALEPADAAVAGTGRPWVEVQAVCGAQRQSFGVRFVQSQPQVYTFAATTGASGPAEKAAGGAAALAQVQARFDLSGYTGCPLCGLPGLVQCDRCGTIMCGSAIHQHKRGDFCLCPQCGGKGRIESGGAVAVQGRAGGAKGKPGGK